MRYEVWYDTDTADDLCAGSFDSREEAEDEKESLEDEYRDEFGTIPVRIIEVVE